jgi:hypothetical protein
MNRLFDRAKMSDRPADRSNAYKKIAEEFARYGQYRAAIAAGERCEFPNDRVAAFTAILERYFIRNGSLMISNTVSPMHQ